MTAVVVLAEDGPLGKAGTQVSVDDPSAVGPIVCAFVTLEEDGPLGDAGLQVWVNDPADARTPSGSDAKPAKAKQGAES